METKSFLSHISIHQFKDSRKHKCSIWKLEPNVFTCPMDLFHNRHMDLNVRILCLFRCYFKSVYAALVSKWVSLQVWLMLSKSFLSFCKSSRHTVLSLREGFHFNLQLTYLIHISSPVRAIAYRLYWAPITSQRKRENCIYIVPNSGSVQYTLPLKHE
jgi:hypothetical protein